MLDLCDELLLIILQYLPLKDLLNVRRVCQHLHSLSTDTSLWPPFVRQVCQKHGIQQTDNTHDYFFLLSQGIWQVQKYILRTHEYHYLSANSIIKHAKGQRINMFLLSEGYQVDSNVTSGIFFHYQVSIYRNGEGTVSCLGGYILDV